VPGSDASHAESRDIAVTAARAAAAKQAADVTILDVHSLIVITDYFVIASGTSDAHVRGIAEHVMDRLGRGGHRTHHVEGLGGRWVLIDFVDFVIHLFHPETRAFYQLERLWGDAPELLIRSS